MPEKWMVLQTGHLNMTIICMPLPSRAKIMNSRAFIDTSFIVAALNASDSFHDLALIQSEELFEKFEIWITDAVLFEVGNTFSKVNKSLGADFIQSCFDESDTYIVHTNAEMFLQAVSMYAEFIDKKWSLTDCLSFIVMKDNGIHVAYSSDHHFEQAGFQYTLR